MITYQQSENMREEVTISPCIVECGKIRKDHQIAALGINKKNQRSALSINAKIRGINGGY